MTRNHVLISKRKVVGINSLDGHTGSHPIHRDNHHTHASIPTEPRDLNPDGITGHIRPHLSPGTWILVVLIAIATQA